LKQPIFIYSSFFVLPSQLQNCNVEIGWLREDA
jgi:hypothetical protein